MSMLSRYLFSLRLSSYLIFSVFLVACGGGGGSSSNTSNSTTTETTPSLDQQLRATITQQGLTGDPRNGQTVPDISEPLAQLGMRLFFSKALGGDTDVACVSCHHPSLGGTDGLSLPVGVSAVEPDVLGEGREQLSSAAHFDGGPNVSRNAPTTFNVSLWSKALFHDGQLEFVTQTAEDGSQITGIRSPAVDFGTIDPDAANSLLATQALFSPVARDEMLGFSLQFAEDLPTARIQLLQRIIDQQIPNQWLAAFQQAFNSTADAAALITMRNVSQALATYQSSQVFIDSPWRNYVQGDDAAINDAAKRGALLFFTEVADGGAGCATCHQGDLFSDQQFHVLAMPQIGRGKTDGELATGDFGRFRQSGAEVDRYAFRTPSLLNVAVTAPYSHAGAYLDLESVVRHHLNVSDAVANYDYNLSEFKQVVQHQDAAANTQAALTQLQANHAAGLSSIQDVNLTDTEVADLLSFLNSLTDPCVTDRSCLAAWIPLPEMSIDHLQLNAMNAAHDLL